MSKNKERDRLFKTYNSLYSTHFSEDAKRNCCFYCGDVAGTVDHVPPLSWVESKTTKEWKKSKIPFVRIQCCVECNRMLGSKPLFTVYERVEFLEKKLLDQYEKRSTLWSKEEIAEMSAMFQRQIIAKQNQAKQLLARARGLQQRLMKFDSFPITHDF